MSKVSKKKGLSMEEKVARIEAWFVNNPSPYTLKDLTGILPKVTGVIPQSVEECLEILVSEGRVRQKKVGIHVLFWLFPKTATQQLANSIGGKTSTAEVARYLRMSEDELHTELEKLRESEQNIQRQIEEMRAAIGTRADVTADLEKMQSLRSEIKELEGELSQHSLTDPAFIGKLKSATMVAWESANRWTDNMFLLEQHITQRLGLSARELRAQLQLPLEIDYVELEELLPPSNGGITVAELFSGDEACRPTAGAAYENHDGGDVSAASQGREVHTEVVEQGKGETLSTREATEDVEPTTSTHEQCDKKRKRGRPPFKSATSNSTVDNASCAKRTKKEAVKPAVTGCRRGRK